MANSEPEVRNGIEVHKGNTNILLIAPHGVETVPMDDENTAALVRRIQGQTGFSALINTLFRKPEGPLSKKRNKGKLDLQNNFANLNKIKQAEQVKDYITKIKKVVDTDGLTYVIWIHGIADENIKEFGDDVQCLIGYGQPEAEGTLPRDTAEREFIDLLEKELNEKGIKSILAPTECKYRGWSEDYMNQWFRLKKYDFKQVQSVQLEFKFTGCRDKEASINDTAEKLVAVFKAVFNIGKEPTPPADETLVQTAYNKLAQVFSKNYERALMEAGQYIVRTFYGGEEGIEDQGYDENMVLSQETIENARDNKSQRKASLHQLFQKLNENTNSKAPSRGWFYNAVNLVVQHHDMKKLLKTRFHTYGNLFLSHKVALLKVKDSTKKQELIEEESKNPSTVRDFIQKVQKLVPPGTDKPLTLPSLLKKPDELIKEEHAEKLTIEALKSKQARTLENLKKITKEKHQNVQTEIDTLKKHLETRQKSLEKYVEVQGNIEEAIQFKNNAQQRPKKKASKTKVKEKELRKSIKNNEWTKSKNNFNISTGCSNDCLYCYGRYMPYARKLAKDAEAKGEEWNWKEPTIRQKDVQAKHSLRDGRVGFPTSHDITPDNLQDSLKVLKKILEAGNDVLVISKPRLDCIKAVCQAFPTYKEKILFRFTISGKSEEVLSFWEPNAPSYDERWEALKYAFDKGFQTSVSIEPMLEYARAQEMVQDFMPYVTDAIWFGKMNHIPAFKDPDGHLKEELAKVEAGHTEENIKALYEIYKDNPKIKWKLAFKDVLGIPLPPAPGMDV
jgi:DNA repair photolyase